MKIVYGIIVPSELELSNKISEITDFLEKEYNAKMYYNVFNNIDIIGVELESNENAYIKMNINLMNDFPETYKLLFEKMFGFILNIWNLKIQEKTNIYMEQKLTETEIDDKMKSLILPDSLSVDWFLINDN